MFCRERFERVPLPPSINESWAVGQRFSRTFGQTEKPTPNRLCQGEEESSGRTQTEKQFSIESILGKDETLCRENSDFSEIFPPTQNSPYFSDSGQAKSYFREMQDFEDLRRDGGRRMKSKRIRTIFTPEQLERMEEEFHRQQYMVGPERLYLASRLNLTEAQVKVWFQNRRIKWRKQNMHVQQNKLEILRTKQQQQQMMLMNQEMNSTHVDQINLVQNSNMQESESVDQLQNF
eukprot:TRINITY_DN75547_c0_g1_i1.p1 TRINITY_DN75547_c0_g1~~TRINITY_DN75547_c0_g1_i1.p1  ORF type:complete len:234 (+),score=66.62 TRINITY_DN75547_c0_g1_i1:63-764(+)